MGQGKSLLALTVVKNAQHECRLQGCNVRIPFDQIKEHEEKCPWRLIICPGSNAACRAMVPFCTVLTHAQNCPNCIWPPIQANANNAQMRSLLNVTKAHAYEKYLCWKTAIFQLEQGVAFFVRMSKEKDIYKIDVVMNGSKEDCKEFTVEASILDAAAWKSTFKATFQPRLGEIVSFFNNRQCHLF